jgi:prepilin peptidase CpaA
MNGFSKDVCYLAAANGVAALGACEDLRSRRIPNALTGTAMLIGVVLHLLVGGPKDSGNALLAGMCAGALLLVMYVAGGMGAGDVKLMAAVGCLAGPSSIRSILTGTFLFGAIFGIGLALYHRRLKQTVSNAMFLFGFHGQKHKADADSRDTSGVLPHPDEGFSVPYAVPIAAGCLMSLGTLLWGG